MALQQLFKRNAPIGSICISWDGDTPWSCPRWGGNQDGNPPPGLCRGHPGHGAAASTKSLPVPGPPLAALAVLLRAGGGESGQERFFCLHLSLYFYANGNERN